MIDWIYPLLLVGAALIVVSVFTSLVSFRFGAPLLLLFLGIGLGAGSDGLGIEFSDVNTAYFVGSLALAVILFDSGFGTSLKSFRQAAAPSIVLATVGVLLTTAIVGMAARLMFGFGWAEGLLMGAIVSSTDAAAVFFLLRVGGITIRDKVRSTLEVESGSNDPMAIFLVGAMLFLIESPSASPLQLAPDFVIQMVMGAIVGVGVGFAMPEILKRGGYQQGGLAFVISIAAALIAFGLAEVLAGNGFLASYLAGIVAGNRTYAARETVSGFQDGMAWLSQVVMFFTLGLLVTPSNLGPVIIPGLSITFILMFVARPLSVFICLAPFRQFDWRAKLFVSWAGLRGAVPIVLATFPMVAGVPGAFAIFNVVFFVVLLSSVIQGPTIKWAADRLGVRS